MGEVPAADLTAERPTGAFEPVYRAAVPPTPFALFSAAEGHDTLAGTRFEWMLEPRGISRVTS